MSVLTTKQVVCGIIGAGLSALMTGCKTNLSSQQSNKNLKQEKDHSTWHERFSQIKEGTAWEELEEIYRENVSNATIRERDGKGGFRDQLSPSTGAPEKKYADYHKKSKKFLVAIEFEKGCPADNHRPRTYDVANTEALALPVEDFTSLSFSISESTREFDPTLELTADTQSETNNNASDVHNRFVSMKNDGYRIVALGFDGDSDKMEFLHAEMNETNADAKGVDTRIQRIVQKKRDDGAKIVEIVMFRMDAKPYYADYENSQKVEGPLNILALDKPPHTIAEFVPTKKNGTPYDISKEVNLEKALIENWPEAKGDGAQHTPDFDQEEKEDQKKLFNYQAVQDHKKECKEKFLKFFKEEFWTKFDRDKLVNFPEQLKLKKQKDEIRFEILYRYMLIKNTSATLQIRTNKKDSYARWIISKDQLKKDGLILYSKVEHEDTRHLQKMADYRQIPMKQRKFTVGKEEANDWFLSLGSHKLADGSQEKYYFANIVDIDEAFWEYGLDTPAKPMCEKFRKQQQQRSASTINRGSQPGNITV